MLFEKYDKRHRVKRLYDQLEQAARRVNEERLADYQNENEENEHG